MKDKKTAETHCKCAKNGGEASRHLLDFVDALGEKAILGNGISIDKIIINYIERQYSHAIANLVNQGYSTDDITVIIQEYEKQTRAIDKVNITVEHVKAVVDNLKTAKTILPSRCMMPEISLADKTAKKKKTVKVKSVNAVKTEAGRKRGRKMKKIEVTSSPNPEVVVETKVISEPIPPAVAA